MVEFDDKKRYIRRIFKIFEGCVSLEAMNFSSCGSFGEWQIVNVIVNWEFFLFSGWKFNIRVYPLPIFRGIVVHPVLVFFFIFHLPFISFAVRCTRYCLRIASTKFRKYFYFPLLFALFWNAAGKLNFDANTRVRLLRFRVVGI